ncbi:MAG TPA: DNA-binding domain-containing protein [Burkholderiales bacterium]|nr:DNA-binding domain-containing protein [Burkholderiales bacterium]
MRSLRELQAEFARALRAPASDGRAPGLAVYRANVEGNLASALAGAYPIVRKIVGQGYFAQLCRAYAARHSSASGDLNRYGSQFAHFLGDYAEVADLPYLPDVARIEWLVHFAYYAQDPDEFDANALAGVPAERYAQLRPRLAPPCAVLSSAWPLGRIWAVHQDDYRGAFDVDLRAGPDRILVHRPRWRASVSSLGAGDFHFLEAAARGAQLGAAVEAALAAEPGFDPSAALLRWIHARVIDRLA